MFTACLTDYSSIIKTKTDDNSIAIAYTRRLQIWLLFFCSSKCFEKQNKGENKRHEKGKAHTRTIRIPLLGTCQQNHRHLNIMAYLSSSIKAMFRQHASRIGSSNQDNSVALTFFPRCIKLSIPCSWKFKRLVVQGSCSAASTK